MALLGILVMVVRGAVSSVGNGRRWFRRSELVEPEGRKIGKDSHEARQCVQCSTTSCVLSLRVEQEAELFLHDCSGRVLSHDKHEDQTAKIPGTSRDMGWGRVSVQASSGCSGVNYQGFRDLGFSFPWGRVCK